MWWSWVRVVGRIGGEGDGSADEVFELPAGDAELLAEADGGEVAVAVVGGAPGELVRGRAADAAHGGRLLDGEELLPGVAHGRLLQFDARVDADGQRTIAVRRTSEATGSTRIDNITLPTLRRRALALQIVSIRPIGTPRCSPHSRRPISAPRVT